MNRMKWTGTRRMLSPYTMVATIRMLAVAWTAIIARSVMKIVRLSSWVASLNPPNPATRIALPIP